MKIINESKSPSVGPFYVIGTRVISANDPIRDVLPIGDSKDSDNSHYKLWKALQRNNPSLKKFDYDYMPRGRVVYNVKTREFNIMIDSDITDEDVKNIADEFGIPSGSYKVLHDEHYKCHLCNQDYVNITEGVNI